MTFEWPRRQLFRRPGMKLGAWHHGFNEAVHWSTSHRLIEFKATFATRNAMPATPGSATARNATRTPPELQNAGLVLPGFPGSCSLFFVALLLYTLVLLLPFVSLFPIFRVFASPLPLLGSLREAAVTGPQCAVRWTYSSTL